VARLLACRNGRLGSGTQPDWQQPLPVKGSLKGLVVRAVAAGSAHTLALTDTGAVFAW
jgi:alpha-tubulin suppressor-like RCC1 family protein